jgi:hypothetical protein
MLTQSKLAESAPAGEGIRVFTGWERFFEPLNAQHREIRAALELATRAELLEAARKLGSGYIACHVRRGDMRNDRGEFQTSTAWFEGVIKRIREMGRREAIYLFSDGTETELQSLLAPPDVRRVSTGSAIGDIWGLSQGVCLIASGGSTFSMWAAYLGQMPFITPPGHPPAYFHLQTSAKGYCGELDPAAPVQSWLDSWR